MTHKMEDAGINPAATPKAFGVAVRLVLTQQLMRKGAVVQDGGCINYE